MLVLIRPTGTILNHPASLDTKSLTLVKVLWQVTVLDRVRLCRSLVER